MGKKDILDKDVRKIAAVAEAQQWTVKKNRGGHLQFIPPDKARQVVVFSSTSSDWRGVRNLRSQLRRSGLVIR